MSATISNSMSPDLSFFGCYVYHLVGHRVHLHSAHHVHLHVSHHVGHHNVVLTLCEGSETLTEWKSESITDLPIAVTE